MGGYSGLVLAEGGEYLSPILVRGDTTVLSWLEEGVTQSCPDRGRGVPQSYPGRGGGGIPQSCPGWRKGYQSCHGQGVPQSCPDQVDALVLAGGGGGTPGQGPSLGLGCPHTWDWCGVQPPTPPPPGRELPPGKDLGPVTGETPWKGHEISGSIMGWRWVPLPPPGVN